MRIRLGQGIDERLFFLCPACGEEHAFGKGWYFNGDLQNPTIRDSIKVTGHSEMRGPFVCHSWITDGKIKYDSDCTHEFANQTLDLLEY